MTKPKMKHLCENFYFCVKNKSKLFFAKGLWHCTKIWIFFFLLFSLKIVAALLSETADVFIFSYNLHFEISWVCFLLFCLFAFFFYFNVLLVRVWLKYFINFTVLLLSDFLESRSKLHIKFMKFIQSISQIVLINCNNVLLV